MLSLEDHRATALPFAGVLVSVNPCTHCIGISGTVLLLAWYLKITSIASFSITLVQAGTYGRVMLATTLATKRG